MAGPDRTQAADDLFVWDYWHVIVRRRHLVAAIFLTIVGLAALRSFLTRPVYLGAAQLLIERDTPKVLSFKEVSEINAGQWGDEYYQTQYKLLQSRALARQVIEDMNLLQDLEFGGPRSPQEMEAFRKAAPGEMKPLERVISDYLDRLRIQPLKNSRLVAVGFEAFRPDLAAQVANRHAQLYIQQSLARRYQTSAEAAQWLGTQIDDQRKKVETAEQALLAHEEKEGIVNIEERRTLLEQKLKEVGSALTTMRTERLQKEALYQQMKNARNPEELPEVMRSPLVQSLRIELANLERQQALLLGRYLEQHPEVEKVRNQMKETRQRIVAESQRVIRSAENDYRASVAQEANLAAALEQAKAEARDLSGRSHKYDSLKGDLDASKEVLASLLARHKQTDVAQELKSSNISIVDLSTVPEKPVRPRRSLDVLVGVIFGLVAGIGLAFLLDYLDNTLRTPDDVRRHLTAPVLTVIPETEAKKGQNGLLLIGGSQQSPFFEGYRLLRTALSYSWPEQRPRVLAVTSTAPGEGKTLTSVNLALTLASMDSRVLLIDCDLRKSQVHSVLRAKRVPGLSDILVGQAKPSEAIQRVVGTNLSFLPAGRSVPSPADLLTVQGLRGLVEGLRSLYNWIVIDTPPVAAVADALIVCQIIDGAIIVAGAEMVPTKAVRQTLERVGETGARILGVVLNRARIERHSYYYGSHYGHYYGAYREGAGPRDTATFPKRVVR